MRVIHKILLVCIVMVSTVGCDQITKNVAKEKMQYAMPVSFFHDTIRLEYTENPGAMLGFGADWPFHLRFWLLTIGTGLFLMAVPLYIFLNHRLSPLQTVGLSFALGGGASNLIDRWVNDGNVIDFLNLGIGTFRTGIFNLADVFVLLGFGLFLSLSTRWHEEATP